jgi:hypothetical protein
LKKLLNFSRDISVVVDRGRETYWREWCEDPLDVAQTFRNGTLREAVSVYGGWVDIDTASELKTEVTLERLTNCMHSRIDSGLNNWMSI